VRKGEYRMSGLQSLIDLPIVAEGAGLFISRGMGSHPDRVIDSFELIYVRDGALEMFEEDARFVIAAGQSIILRPGRRHGGGAPYDSRLSYYWVHFNIVKPAIFAQVDSLLPQHIAVRRPEHLTDLFRRLLDDYETRQTDSLSASLLVLLMLHEVTSSPVMGGDIGRPPASRVLASRAETFVTTHFHENISTRDIARAVKCNPDYLSRVYRSAFGITITESIVRHRMNKARALLRETDVYLDDVARQCGIEDLAYFRRIFKRHTGMTPLAFRKIYARGYVNTE